MPNIQINAARLQSRMREMGEIGALKGGGVCRLALSDEDRKARKLFIKWLEQCSADVMVDRIGNIFGFRKGLGDIPPVMVGSHLDTVTTGGLYDGSLGVLAGLEIMQVLHEQNAETKRPFAVANFTNEEGVRFAPGMTGSKAFAGNATVEELLAVLSVDEKTTIAKELKRIGFDGNMDCGGFNVHRFIELHIEQGPILEKEQKAIGAVASVQGIYWTEYTITGETGHAGTTPMDLRKDAGYVAAQINNYIRELTHEFGGVGTVGFQEITPNATNVIPEKARVRVDFRHPKKNVLKECQQKMDAFVDKACKREETSHKRKALIRATPVQFDETVVEAIEESSRQLGYPVRRMASGAGHDAQMMAEVCPAAMIFIPCRDGISHNVNEYAKEEDIEAGANVMLNGVLKMLQE